MFANTILILELLTIIETAKILVVVPTPSISHQVVFRPLIHGLISRNHEVTVITPDPVYTQGGSPKNLKEIDLHNLSYTLWIEWFKEIENIDQNDFLAKLTVAYRLLSKVFEEQIKDSVVQQLIKDKTQKFDLLIVEALVTSTLIFSYIYKAPVIQMSSFGANSGNMDVIGAPTHPLLYPFHYHRRVYNLSILEKISELYKHILIDRMVEKQEHMDNLMLQRLFGSGTPPLNDLKNNVHMLFLNVHPIWIHNQPVPSNVIYTWGIHKVPEKSLPKDLQSYLDSAENGVIYISFGTNIDTSSIPLEKLQILLEVISQLPCNVLWKWDTNEMPGKSNNIKISKWFPQSDVLRHPNVKLFITQGGLQSTDEAITYGVPLIGIPMLADQEYNSEKYVYFKIGVKLEFKSLTVERFQNAIDTVFKHHRRYRKNIIKLRTMMLDVPKPPLENAIWWVEYVLRHGGASQLRSPAANMPWTQYYELELVLVMLGALVLLGTVLLLLVYFTFMYISRIINFQKNKTKIL